MEKIIFVTRNMKAGGAERVISQLANNFSRLGIQCIIITLENKEIFYQLDPSVKIHAIERKSGNAYVDKLLRYKEMRFYIKHNNPNVVLALPEEIGIYVIPVMFGTNIPVVVSERNNPWAMPWKKETRCLRQLVYPFSKGFIFQTEQAASFFPEYIRKKGIVLPNPLDLERIPKPWEGQRRKEIVGAGRLEKQKNFPLLIRGFAKFYQNHLDYVLTIYGEGALKEELETLAESLLPSRAYTFPGRTNKLLDAIKGAAMFVLSSDYEGMPNVVIEAMAMGMPVISTDCPSGGSLELIENGKNGLLVSVGDAEALYKSMCGIADDKVYAEILGKNALAIREKLDATIISEKWREYLDAVSAKK